MNLEQGTEKLKKRSHNLEQNAERLKERSRNLKQNTKSLRKRNRDLERELQSVHSSKIWQLLDGVNQFKKRLSRLPGR